MRLIDIPPDVWNDWEREYRFYGIDKVPCPPTTLVRDFISLCVVNAPELVGGLGASCFLLREFTATAEVS